jgi:hypothetical protein
MIRVLMFLLLFTLHASLFTPSQGLACSVCIGWAQSQGVSGFYWSALLLTALPFAVIGTIGAWAWKRLRIDEPGGRDGDRQLAV